MTKSGVHIWERRSICSLPSIAIASNSWFFILLASPTERARIWFVLSSIFGSNSLLILHRWHRRILPWSSHLRSCEIIALSEKWPTCMPKTTLCNLLSRTAMRYSVPRKWKHHFIPNTIRLGRRATLHSELYISCFLAIGIWQALCLDEPAV